VAQKTQDFNATDFQQRYLAPFARFNALAVRHFEQTARLGYEMAGDMLELAIAQARATVEAKDATVIASRQSELAAAFIDRQARRTADWMKIAERTQSDLSDWAGKTAETAAGDFKTAARQAA
jgi:hypothetical protein